MIRLFVGLTLPEDLAEALAGLGFGLPGARWVSQRNLHVTLRFIGEVDETEAEEIHHQLAALAEPAVPLTVAGLGLFGDSHRAHTLWAGVERSEPLVRLAARINAAVVRAGLKPDSRRYSPHVTLARIRDCAPAHVQAFIAGAPMVRAADVAVTDFALFRSHLGRGEPEYEVLERYPLG